MKYRVTITETLTDTVEVEAEDAETASVLVAHDYYNGDIVLTADNSFVECDFAVAE